MPVWTELLVPAAVGALGGLHAATWGMYKDSPHEGFGWRTYFRSVWVGMALGPLVALLFGLWGRSAGELLLLFGATYAAERLAHEFYKTWLRREDQSKYFIPMAFHVRGRVLRHTGLRLVLGALYLSGLVAVGLGIRAYNGLALPAELHWTIGLLLGSVGGWVSAFGGAWKDAPIEGFDLRKFFRSPVIALLFALLCQRFTADWLLVAIAAVGYTIATTETYKTFFFPSVPRGKFAGKPVLFPRMLRLRQYAIPLYAGIWVVVLGTVTRALGPLGLVTMSTPLTPSVRAVRRPYGSFRGLLTRRIGSPAADRVLWGSAIVGAIILLLAIAAPALAPLVLFLLLTVWTNGPYSPVLPATYEPILMLFGKLYPPLLIGVVATAGTVYVEYLNYHLYAAGADRLPGRVRTHPLLARVEGWYARAPFATVVVAAFTPLPYWLVRVLSALTRYPVRRHLVATAIGRFPRLWFFAAIATPLGIPTPWLVLASVAVLGVMVLVAGARILRRRVGPRAEAAPVPLSPSAEVPCCS